MMTNLTTTPETTLLELLRGECDVIFKDDFRLYVDRYKLICIADGNRKVGKRTPIGAVGLENALQQIELMREDREMDRMEND